MSMPQSAYDPREPVPGARDEVPGSRDEAPRFDPATGQPLNEAAHKVQADNMPQKPPNGADTRAEAFTRDPRADERYQAPPERIEGEGVKTGPPHDHYVHLADGSVITGHAGGTHFHDAERGLIPVVSVFPMGTQE